MRVWQLSNVHFAADSATRGEVGGPAIDARCRPPGPRPAHAVPTGHQVQALEYLSPLSLPTLSRG